MAGVFMKRRTFRKRSFLAVFVFCAVVSAVLMQRASTQAANGEKMLAHRIYGRMAEEAALTAEVLLTEQEISKGSLTLHCKVIDTCASMLGEETTGVSAATAAASFFRALSARMNETEPQTVNADEKEKLYAACTDYCAQQLAVLSQAVLSDDRELIAAVSNSLTSLAGEFAKEALAENQKGPLHSYSFDGEKVLSPTQAGKSLKKILGQAASLMHTPLQAGADGNYLFQCQNAYAIVSASGGHLIRYSLHTKTLEDGIVSRCLNTDDLVQEVALFLEKNGISGIEITEDVSLHGVRYFYCKKTNEEARCARIGVREGDGRIVYADLENLYRIQ